MKALSLRQPWAWLVVHGGKGIENRKWNTRLRGRFLIHSSKGMTREEYDGAVAFARAVDPAIVVPAIVELERGGIVGRAMLERVLVPCQEQPCPHPWHMAEQFGFVLANVEPLPFRPLKGCLGFFDAANPHLHVTLPEAP